MQLRTCIILQVSCTLLLVYFICELYRECYENFVQQYNFFTINPKAQTLNQVFTPYLQKKWIECKQIQNSALSKQDLTEASNNTKFHFQQE